MLVLLVKKIIQILSFHISRAEEVPKIGVKNMYLFKTGLMQGS